MPQSNAPLASIAEISRGIHRISVAMPPSLFPGGFSFNQYLVEADEPLLFHTGPRKLFPLVRTMLETVMPASALRWIAFSHVEADECGAMPELLALAPNARPVCSRIGAMVSAGDLFDAEPLGMDDGQVLDIGGHRLIWQSTPHLPHGWDCGYLFDASTKTLFCGDLFTQGGTGEQALTHDDLVEPSEAFRRPLDYFAHGRDTARLLDKLAALRPETLACMHGSVHAGDGAGQLRRLAGAISR